MTTTCVPSGSGYASGVRTSSPAPAGTQAPVPADAGAITGSLSYPSSGIVAQLVYAVSTSGPTSGAYSVETVEQQAAYTLVGVLPGTYFVYSAVRPVSLSQDCRSAFGAGYTQAVACGFVFGCNDHRPIPVAVRAGETTSGIDVIDWYASLDSGFPPAPPASIVPDSRWPAPTFGAFPTAKQAIADSAPALLKAQLVEGDRSACPVNRACLTLSNLTDGPDAAYMVGHVGSNQNILQCTLLAYRDAAGWHKGGGWLCRADRPFPALGESGQVFFGIAPQPTDCVQIRTQPGPTAPTAGCLTQGTPVEIDEGPAYVPPAASDYPPDGFWWHIRGKGWIINEYLRLSP